MAERTVESSTRPLTNISRRIAEIAGRTPNRGDRHVVLGHPWSDGAEKTVVEPGGSFSPGVWTCGISLWVASGDVIASGDQFDATDPTFEFGSGGQPPLVRSSWSQGGVYASTVTASAASDPVVVDAMRARWGGPTGVSGHVVVRSSGPAGGPLVSLEWIDGHLELGGGRQLVATPAPEEIEFDSDDVGRPVAVLSWRDKSAVELVVTHGWADRSGGDLMPAQPARIPTADEVIAQAEWEWSTAVPAEVFAPDESVRGTWQTSAYHILAQAELGVPLIGAVDYPVTWIRDSTIAARALDLIGRHDLARAGVDHITETVFSGGFGAEADAPGQGLAVITHHAELTGDTSWLRERMSRVRDRVHWLDRMRTTSVPLRTLSRDRMPAYWGSPAINLVCNAADDGVVRGRMDWHQPDFFINAWVYAGYDAAAKAADMVGDTEQADQWRAHATVHCGILAERLLPAYGNERDPAVAPHPSGWSPQDNRLREAFAHWYRTHRLDSSGERVPEKLWTYFEAAQAHNAIRLGLVEEAWTSLHGMLHDQEAWKLGAFGEGEPGGSESLPFRNDIQRVGWLNPQRARHGNMPHVWTAAELIAAIRTVFVLDDGPELILGAGVPQRWAQPGATFGVRNLPTRLGVLTYTAEYDGQRWRIDAQTPAPWRPSSHL